VTETVAASSACTLPSNGRYENESGPLYPALGW
jgi:hypothetical protein